MSSTVYLNDWYVHCKPTFYLTGGVNTFKTSHIFRYIAAILLMTCICTLPVLALTEAEVEREVESVGKEAVTGNVLIWFLCAVAFLKVSQKIDSFMSGLGVNVGHTGGSLLGEVIIAAKTISAVASGAGRALGFGGGKSSRSPESADSAGFFKGGLVGMASRKVGSDAAKMATSVKSTSTAHTVAKEPSNQGASPQVEPGASQAGRVQSEPTIHTESQSGMEHDSSHTTVQTTQGTDTVTLQDSTPFSGSSSPSHLTSIGGAVFMSSLQKGGDFANNVIGRVAKGDIRTAGSITGDMAVQSMMSYMGYTAQGGESVEKISYREVEMGGGRITGIEITPQNPDGIAFGMYSADQYSKPDGEFAKVTSADGAQWYKQYAIDSVKKVPYEAPDGKIAYQSEIVKRLPQPPKRKDRI